MVVAVEGDEVAVVVDKQHHREAMAYEVASATWKIITTAELGRLPTAGVDIKAWGTPHCAEGPGFYFPHPVLALTHLRLLPMLCSCSIIRNTRNIQKLDTQQSRNSSLC